MTQTNVMLLTALIVGIIVIVSCIKLFRDTEQKDRRKLITIYVCVFCISALLYAGIQYKFAPKIEMVTPDEGQKALDEYIDNHTR